MGYDFAMPDSAVFYSRMIADDFSITKMGEDDLRMMNNSFTHRVYERDRMISSFTVGPENPAFTPIDYISPYLRNSILTSEDGGFYSHKGFNEDAFRQSIVENIKKRRFARGGSTITMQLVKNVYLKRDKVISRKLEEALIVWLIENQRLVSKHRMFEVYLNIIEWGPGIYGINEASAFYFLKHPSELTLAESIFLASIVPRPKLFRYSFDEFGNLRGYLEGYYRLLAGIMLRRGQITQTEYDSLTPHIVLQGPARDLVLPPDSLHSDPWLEDVE
jgi:membrane peptidoglycan carboxypeptidase